MNDMFSLYSCTSFSLYNIRSIIYIHSKWINGYIREKGGGLIIEMIPNHFTVSFVTVLSQPVTYVATEVLHFTR